MKLNIQNLTSRHRRICLVPSPTGSVTLPDPIQNPTVGTDADRVIMCLAPRPNITCVGASSTALFQLYIGMDNSRTAFRLRATVNGEVGTLNIAGNGPWLDYFAFNVQNQIYVQDVLFMVYPFRFASGAYAYYVRMVCLGTGEKRVELAVDNLEQNTNIKLPFIAGGDLGIADEVVNPTMLAVDPNKAHACLVPAKPISCVGATYQSGCVELGNGTYEVTVNDEVVSANISAEDLLALGSFRGVSVAECHEPTTRHLPAFTLMTPNYVFIDMDLGPNNPNAPAMAGIRILHVNDGQTGNLYSRLSVAIDNDYFNGGFITIPSSYGAVPPDETPVYYSAGSVESPSGVNGGYSLNYALWKIKIGNRYGWEIRFNIAPNYEVGYSHAIFLALRSRGSGVDVDNITFTPGTLYELPAEPTVRAYKMTIAGFGA